MQITELLLATSNPSKVREIRDQLADLPIHITCLADLARDEPEPEEHGSSFAENALIKANYWHEKTGLPTLADDGGLLVDALPGELGVRTRRWAEELGHTTDESWLAYFMERMRDVPTGARGAEFRIALALIQRGSEDKIYEHAVRGRITEEIAAPIKPGIPVSSVFLADGASTVFAAMTAAEKARYSHRGGALQQLRADLLLQ